ncbi:MAG: SsrA-binding protein SmpB [Flavobacteriales bacterium]|jgi:SsrA-binding protein|nr:SsrA-binding protein SmpB [Flavobacteriales bacterium]
MARNTKKTNIRIQNKKARFEFEILDTYTCGIILTGTEIKSLRLGKASIGESYAYVHNLEVWVKEMYIAEYSHGSYNNHVTKRNRKLLLTKKEIRKIESKLQNVGFTLIPLELFINEKGLAKLKLAVAKGKKLHDKRNTLKDRDIKRQLDRVSKRY